MFKRLSKRLPKNLSSAYGFTLIELMIAVAIIGILASIAYPSYMSSVQKSKRTGAKIAIMEVAQGQERFFSINMKYAHDLAALNANAITSGNADDYTVTVAGLKSDGNACTSSDICVTYTVKAIPKTTSPQKNDSSCKEFTLTHTGIQAAEDENGVDTSSTCW